VLFGTTHQLVVTSHHCSAIRRRWNTHRDGTSQPRGLADVVGDARPTASPALLTPGHGPAFLEALPSIIAKVEAGWHPPEQAGDDNLQLQLWRWRGGHPERPRRDGTLAGGSKAMIGGGSPVKRST
jgi:hypothetical protein